jgi:hypothetical protein
LNIEFSAETNNVELAAAASGTIEGAAMTIPPANIIVINVRLVILRPISLFMLLVFFNKISI